MGERDVGMDELASVFGKWHVFEEWRCDQKRMNRGTHVVDETRLRQLLGARSSSDSIRSLQHGYGAARLGHGYGGGQPVRPRADDDCVVFRTRHGARLSPAPGPRTHRSFTKFLQ